LLVRAAGLVQDRRERAHHSVEVLRVDTVRGGGGCQRLVEPAIGGEQLVALRVDRYAVRPYLRMRHFTEQTAVHEWKVRHIEKILDRAQSRHMNPHRAEPDDAGVWLVELGNRKEFV